MKLASGYINFTAPDAVDSLSESEQTLYSATVSIKTYLMQFFNKGAADVTLDLWIEYNLERVWIEKNYLLIPNDDLTIGELYYLDPDNKIMATASIDNVVSYLINGGLTV